MNVSSINAGGDAVARLAHTNPLQLKGAALRNASPADQRVAVAAQFEAILVRQLLGKTMNSMLGGEEGGVAGSIYGDMLADTLSQQLTSGQGLGLGKMLVRQLTPRGELTPTDAAAPAPEKP